ncbi:MAG: glutamylcysteine synthetase, partial [Lachnospiraceae bacterium]|nr:glutamylcysteine synthetase [Lachnospiraceae bacterium]
MAVLNEETIKKSLYEKYIEPTKKERDNFIGIEIEMPIINLNKKPVDFDIIHKLTGEFLERFSFEALGYDENDNIYSAENKETGDVYSYDCSYNNLELSMGKEKELFTIEKRFKIYYEFIQNWLGEYNYTLSGFGVNPYRNYNNNVPIPNGRYRMLFHHLHSYVK